jgi:hypothetical protein
MTMFLAAIGFKFLYLSERNQKINEIGKPDNNKKGIDKTKNFVVFFMSNFCYTPPPYFNNDCPQSPGEDLLSCLCLHLLDLLLLNLEVLEVFVERCQVICQGGVSRFWCAQS